MSAGMNGQLYDPSDPVLPTISEAATSSPKPALPPSRAIPRRPAMKIRFPPSPWGPRSSHLDILVGDAIKASPSPRRNQPEFFCSSLQRGLAAPPPTPVMPTALGETSSEASSEASTPRSSNEVKHVAFVEFWQDDQGGVGKTRSEVDR